MYGMLVVGVLDMTENRSFFYVLIKYSSGHVTFGNGTKGRIVAKENIVEQDLPCLKDVI